MRGLSPLFLGVGVHSLDFVFELKAEKRISWHFGACNLTLERQFKLQLYCEIFVSKSNGTTKNPMGQQIILYVQCTFLHSSMIC